MFAENNKVHVIGEIMEEFVYNNETYGEGFYMTSLKVRRLSGQIDQVPLMVSDRLINVTQNYMGQTVEVNGQFRSHNRHVGLKSHLILHVFAKELKFVDKDDENQICLNGYICKPPVYRKTPLGRDVADLLIAVNRAYGKSDYIPCIVWGRNARYAAGLPVGQNIELHGRIQSREYMKYVNDDQQEKRTAYEVSVQFIA